MKTVQVVDYKYLGLPNGTHASIFSAATPGQKLVTRGYTWQVVDHNGSMTQGLCRVPANTLADAQMVAQTVADKRGYTVLPYGVKQ